MNKVSADILERLRALKPQIAGPMKLKRLRVYGSVARGEADEHSDIDLIADFTITPDLLTFVRYENEMAAFLKRPVDLATEKSLHKALRDNILHEAVDV